MKATKLFLSLGTLALGIASASSSYTLTLVDTVSVGSSQLKAGEYKVEMKGDKAVFTRGKNVVEVPATLSTGDQKFASTSLKSVDSKVSEIDLGGTKSKITFGADAGGSGSKGN